MVAPRYINTSSDLGRFIADSLNDTNPANEETRREILATLELMRAESFNYEAAEKLCAVYRDKIFIAWSVYGADGRILRDTKVRGPLSIKGEPVTRNSEDTWLIALGRVAHEERLYRIQNCTQCKKWFFGKRDRQKFCSEQCQQAYWVNIRATTGIEEARARMRRHRNKQKRKRRAK